jgi:hypothetical protein
MSSYLLPDIDARDGASVDNLKTFIQVAVKFKVLIHNTSRQGWISSNKSIVSTHAAFST